MKLHRPDNIARVLTTMQSKFDQSLFFFGNCRVISNVIRFGDVYRSADRENKTMLTVLLRAITAMNQQTRRSINI